MALSISATRLLLMLRLVQKIRPGSALIVFPAKARRRPGSMSAMGTGLRRCDKVVGVSVEPAAL